MNRRAALTGAAALALAPRALAAEPGEEARRLLVPALFAQAFWAVCDHSLRSGRLERRDTRVFERLRALADEHARALEARLRELGEPPPPRPRRREEIRLPGFGGATTRDDYVSYAAAAASGCVRSWYLAMQELEDPKLLRFAAGAMAADAQIVVAIRRLRGRDPLPAAFELGHPE